MAEPRPIDFERRQHECERAMVGRVVSLNERDWVVASVDHLARVGDLRGVIPNLGGGWGRAGDYSIRNVPVDELAGLAGCSCGHHGWSKPERPVTPEPTTSAPPAASTLAWVSCAKQPPPSNGERIFWWTPGRYPQRWGYLNGRGRFTDDAVVGDDTHGTPASEVTHWAPWPSNEPKLIQLSLDDRSEVTRG